MSEQTGTTAAAAAGGRLARMATGLWAMSIRPHSRCGNSAHSMGAKSDCGWVTTAGVTSRTSSSRQQDPG